MVVKPSPANFRMGEFCLSRYAFNTGSASIWCAVVNDWIASETKPMVVAAKHILTPVAAPMAIPHMVEIEDLRQRSIW